MSKVRPVVLSGGSGTRLWPLSTPERPKQFVPLLGGSSLLEKTLGRVATLGHADEPIVVTGERYQALVLEASRKAGVSVVSITEPVGRNTAPAVIAAALTVDSQDVLVVLPADHVIVDEQAFKDDVSTCVELARQGHIVTLGVVPVRPETGYGYIRVGDPLGPGFSIESFVEKPSREKASEMVADGRHLWNGGMFVVAAEVLLAESDRHLPGLAASIRGLLGPRENDRVPLDDAFGEVEAISLDYGIMEKTDLGAVVPLDAGWSDVGSYASLPEVLERDGSGNALVGRVRAQGVTNSLVHAKTREIVVAGVDDMAIVETEDSVLVIGLDASQAVKDLADPS